MKRRDFLKASIPAALLPLTLGGFSVRALAESPFLESMLPQDLCDDHVLVLIQLFGGNDGLNTVIPIDQYDKLYAARPQLIVPEKDILKLSDTIGLHPELRGFQDLYKDGQLSIIQSVGYPIPNFSHFRSTDIWTTASDYNQYLATGWLGRYLEDKYPNYPFNYPNTSMPDPLAIQIGSVISPVLDGTLASMGMAFTNLNRYFNVDRDDTLLPNTRAGELEKYVRSIGEQVNKFGQKVQDTANSVTLRSILWPAHRTNPLADQLQIVSLLISGGLKSRVYLVTLGGFDTHYSQNTKGNSGQPYSHPQLLFLLQEAISAMLDELKLQGVEKNVLGMTFSEFGRRIKSNSSDGTDHGAAAPQFAFGPNVNPGIWGANPIIPDIVAVEDNISMQYDFRSMYATVIKDWFFADKEVVRKSLLKDFETISFIKGYSSVNKYNNEDARSSRILSISPNPSNVSSLLTFYSIGEQIEISLFDGIGTEMMKLPSRFFSFGTHTLPLTSNDLPTGQYYVGLSSKSAQVTQIFHVIK